jgi:5'(3')-deoxyribonucleotidase
MEKIVVYLDMDGTIFDLYGQNNWLERLRTEDDTVFTGDRRMVTEEVLRTHFPADAYDVRVLSMTPKDATDEYCERVIARKNEWLDRYFPSITKRIYRKYGHNKNLKNSKYAILIDDSEPIRNSWNGLAFDPAIYWG